MLQNVSFEMISINDYTLHSKEYWIFSVGFLQVIVVKKSSRWRSGFIILTRVQAPWAHSRPTKCHRSDSACKWTSNGGSLRSERTIASVSMSLRQLVSWCTCDKLCKTTRQLRRSWGQRWTWCPLPTRRTPPPDRGVQPNGSDCHIRLSLCFSYTARPALAVLSCLAFFFAGTSHSPCSHLSSYGSSPCRPCALFCAS